MICYNHHDKKKYEGKNMHMDYLLYELKFEFFFQRMENINEPSPNVSISTGKSDEVK